MARRRSNRSNRKPLRRLPLTLRAETFKEIKCQSVPPHRSRLVPLRRSVQVPFEFDDERTYSVSLQKFFATEFGTASFSSVTLHSVRVWTNGSPNAGYSNLTIHPTFPNGKSGVHATFESRSNDLSTRASIAYMVPATFQGPYTKAADIFTVSTNSQGVIVDINVSFH